MAIEIKPIPVLRGKAAERFVEEADRNAREKTRLHRLHEAGGKDACHPEKSQYGQNLTKKRKKKFLRCLTCQMEIVSLQYNIALRWKILRLATPKKVAYFLSI